MGWFLQLLQETFRKECFDLLSNMQSHITSQDPNVLPEPCWAGETDRGTALALLVCHSHV